MTKLALQIRCVDGVYYATCDQVPGFLLCNKDKQALDASILSAMEQFFAIKSRHQRKPPSAKKAAPKQVIEYRELAIAA